MITGILARSRDPFHVRLRAPPSRNQDLLRCGGAIRSPQTPDIARAREPVALGEEGNGPGSFFP